LLEPIKPAYDPRRRMTGSVNSQRHQPTRSVMPSVLVTKTYC